MEGASRPPNLAVIPSEAEGFRPECDNLAIAIALRSCLSSETNSRKRATTEEMDTLTVILRDGPVVDSDELRRLRVILDYDAEGNVVSPEVLDAQRVSRNRERSQCCGAPKESLEIQAGLTALARSDPSVAGRFACPSDDSYGLRMPSWASSLDSRV